MKVTVCESIARTKRRGTVSSRPPGILLSLSDLKDQSPWSGRIHKALTMLNNGEVQVFPMTDESVAQRFGEPKGLPL